MPSLPGDHDRILQQLLLRRLWLTGPGPLGAYLIVVRQDDQQDVIEQSWFDIDPDQPDYHMPPETNHIPLDAAKRLLGEQP